MIGSYTSEMLASMDFDFCDGSARSIYSIDMTGDSSLSAFSSVYDSSSEERSSIILDWLRDQFPADFERSKKTLGAEE